MKIPKLNTKLSQQHLTFLSVFSKSCRHTIISMLRQSQSGHPGGSLSSIDYLTLLYTFIISQTGDDIVVSNGHISPAVYSVLSELGYINKKEVINTFRQVNNIFEGHVTRNVPGVLYGTGPLATGFSAATGFALANKLKNNDKKVFALLGDGEMQEGQVYEAINFSHKYHLNNLIAFVDYNKVQLSADLKQVMPISPRKIFKSANWEVIDAKGHDFQNLWKCLCKAYQIKNQPVAIIGHTVMGKGVSFMEKEGRKLKSTWHGKAPKTEECDLILKELTLNLEEEKLVKNFKENIKWKPRKNIFQNKLAKINIKTGQPIVYKTGESTDCRSAYGKALLELAKLNNNILALTADLAESVKTNGVEKEKPNQHFDVGIAEQQMISCAGGLSLNNYIPFTSTFGAFITSRAKDQARVNDINQTNVKMVATHCGLSVGEDGPTHQAIDDMGSMLGFFNTMVIEPADPNHTDRIIRYIATHYGNFYVRMGRHKIPVLTKTDGTPFYDEKYVYEYGKCDVLREGGDLTVVATGSLASEALKAVEKINNPSIDLIIASSPKQFDDNLKKSILKTKKLLVAEDHNVISGYGCQIAKWLLENNIEVEAFKILGVEKYQLSGKAEDLYKLNNLDAEGIRKTCLEIMEIPENVHLPFKGKIIAA